ncbi:MAG: hypothetical protein DRI44_01850 [Chlamydiae bacterium]|nr:MAG: hypothetical protein DRI44_01850 [Chlamydiota bacterium]
MLGFNKNAFAAPVSKNDHTVLINKIAESIVRRRMAVPAVLLIESCKPINRIASQFMIVISPLLALFVSYEQIDSFCDMLQDKNCVEKLLREIKHKNNDI